MKTALDFWAATALVVMCASWGLNQVAIKVALSGIPAASQMGGRSLIAALIVFVWCVFRKVPLFRPDSSLKPGLAVGLLFGVEFALLFWGVQLTTASRAVIFLYMAPFVVAVGGHFALGEPLSGRKIAGLCAAFLGVVVAFVDDLSLPSPSALRGDALCLAAAVLWGLTTILIKGTVLARVAAEKTLLYQLTVSAVLGFVLAALAGERVDAGAAADVLPAFLYQAIWVAAITYLGWFALIREYPASLLSAFTFLTPLFGVVFGAAILGDPLSLHLLAALLLVAAGIYLVNKNPARSRSETGAS